MKPMYDVIEDINKWARDRELDKQDPRGQINKLIEELGELSGAHSRKNTAVIEDSLGDMFVVMSVYALQMKIDLVECINMAVKEISGRKGKMVDGVFVKEADLDFNNVADHL